MSSVTNRRGPCRRVAGNIAESGKRIKRCPSYSLKFQGGGETLTEKGCSANTGSCQESLVYSPFELPCNEVFAIRPTYLGKVLLVEDQSIVRV
jgi:hypothetical protein